MSTRYLSNIALGVAGAFLVVASQAFTAPTFEWLSFGIGIVAVVLSAGIVLKRRGLAQRGLDAITALLGAWTIVESLVFQAYPGAITWLGFAEGAAFAGIALVGLTLHELSTERVVHSLEVHDSERVSDRELAGIA